MPLVKMMLAAVVAPFTGAWIEMGDRSGGGFCIQSLPSRERGLK